MAAQSSDCKLKKKGVKGTSMKLVEIADDSEFGWKKKKKKKKTFTSLENYTNILCNISKY